MSMNTLESRVEDVGDALVSWLSTVLSSLSLVSFQWAPHMRDEPRYPTNPRTECPRAYLRLNNMAHLEDSGIGCYKARFVYQFSVWVQLRQTPGEAHQRKIAQALDLIHTALMQENFDITTVLGINELMNVKVEPADGAPFTEQDHPLGDPQLRVSVAESAWTISGEIRE